MNFGSEIGEAESFAIMDRALELGINFFDTSNSYGTPRGLTEEIVGRWLAQGGGRRDAIVLATKVHNQTGKLARPEANHDTPGLSALKIRRHLEASLARLRTDRVDLYQMHHVDRGCPWDEIWQAMGSLADQGRIVYVGSSNFAGWDIATACQEASRRGLPGLASEQSVYSLANRTVELEVIPACRHYGLGLMCWSPLAGGLLAGAPAADGAGRRGSTGSAEERARRGEQVEAWERLCRGLGEEPSVVALAWLLANPVVSAPIVGPRTVAQLESAVRAVGLALDAQTLARLDEIFPGPGGEAPYAYAW
jgi:aryl-alcohol dehydrogenase-like predicted oxidoreductase